MGLTERGVDLDRSLLGLTGEVVDHAGLAGPELLLAAARLLPLDAVGLVRGLAGHLPLAVVLVPLHHVAPLVRGGGGAGDGRVPPLDGLAIARREIQSAHEWFSSRKGWLNSPLSKSYYK